MSNAPIASRITPQLNAGLFLYCILVGELQFLMSARASKVPIEGLILTSGIDFVRFAVVLLMTSYFFREVWNRLIISIFHLRPIHFQEAITIGLTISLLTH